jgi:hypothetical protein
MKTIVSNATQDVQRETSSINHRKLADLGTEKNEKAPLDIAGATSQDWSDGAKEPTSDADVSTTTICLHFLS